jgi:hypothetical protein
MRKKTLMAIHAIRSKAGARRYPMIPMKTQVTDGIRKVVVDDDTEHLHSGDTSDESLAETSDQ